MDWLDKRMKNQLQKMSGLEDDWPLELRKLPLTKIDSPNFESVTIDKLKLLSSDKLPRLQSYSYWWGALTRIELNFTNEFDSAGYQTTSHTSSYKKCDQKWDGSKKVKKVSLRFHTNGAIYGMKLLDENDNEIDKWDHGGTGSGFTWSQAVIDDGFEIIGVYGD